MTATSGHYYSCLFINWGSHFPSSYFLLLLMLKSMGGRQNSEFDRKLHIDILKNAYIEQVSKDMQT